MTQVQVGLLLGLAALLLWHVGQRRLSGWRSMAARTAAVMLFVVGQVLFLAAHFWR